MKDGFVRVAAMTPALRVADVDYNVDACADAVRAAKAQVVVLPELAITSYTCEDLFLQEVLLDAAEKGVARLAKETAGVDSLVLVGVPVRVAVIRIYYLKLLLWTNRYCVKQSDTSVGWN